jgi:SOS-response transcriptional repressor LexA
MDLTERQQSIFDFIVQYTSQQNRPPSYREIMKEFGICSPNGVTCHIRALEKKGLIKRDKATGRCAVPVRQMVPVSTESMVAIELLSKGWTVRFEPSTQEIGWRSPRGISGSDYRSKSLDEPPAKAIADAKRHGDIPKRRRRK